jgi:hypothetical protein
MDWEQSMFVTAARGGMVARHGAEVVASVVVASDGRT